MESAIGLGFAGMSFVMALFSAAELVLEWDVDLDPAALRALVEAGRLAGRLSSMAGVSVTKGTFRAIESLDRSDWGTPCGGRLSLVVPSPRAKFVRDSFVGGGLESLVSGMERRRFKGMFSLVVKARTGFGALETGGAGGGATFGARCLVDLRTVGSATSSAKT